MAQFISIGYINVPIARGISDIFIQEAVGCKGKYVIYIPRFRFITYTYITIEDAFQQCSINFENICYFGGFQFFNVIFSFKVNKLDTSRSTLKKPNSGRFHTLHFSRIECNSSNR